MVIERRPEIPTVFDGRVILRRSPHAQPGELVVPTLGGNGTMIAPPQLAFAVPGEIMISAYTHDEERPYEIHDLVFDALIGFTDGGVLTNFDPVIAQGLYIDGANVVETELSVLVCQDEDAGGLKFIRNPARVPLMFNPETGLWTFDQPYTLQMGQGLTIVVSNAWWNFTPVALGEDPVTHIRVAITTRGELLELGERVG